MANLAIFESTAYLTPGVAATSADVEVRLVSSGALAAIWSDEAGTVAITNPALAFTDSVDGSFKFYVAGVDRGITVKVTKGAATKTITAAVGTAAQLDQSAIVLQSQLASVLGATGFNLVNGYIDWSVSGNVLTAAVKAWSGNNPSASEPVYIAFRSATPGTGLPLVRTLTAALSISINNTALLGTVNAIAFRLWCVAFDDGGTVRLGIINCVTTSANAGSGRNVDATYPLAGWGIATSVLEADTSDSAQVFYTDTAAVTAKAYATLGYATWETGLATAGTWSAGPTRQQLFGQGVPLPGQTIQMQRNATGAVATGTTVIPYDDTIPQSGEGDQYMTQAITPTSAANVLKVQAQTIVSASIAGVLNASLFKDATANALCSAIVLYGAATATNEIPIALMARVLADVTSAITFKVRAGLNSANTTTFNGHSAARIHGGVINSYLEAEELMG